MIRAVLWDFGGVLTASPFEAFRRFERERGLPEDFIRRVNATNPDTNAWADFEADRIGPEDFDRRFEAESRALGHAVRGADVIRLIGGQIRPRMVEALRRCSQRYLTACITNNVRGGAAATAGHDGPYAEAMSLFRVVVESSKVGVRKPDPRIYVMACEELGVLPSEAVYLDDLGINLKPARALGMTTIKVEDPDVALAELEGVLGHRLA